MKKFAILKNGSVKVYDAEKEAYIHDSVNEMNYIHPTEAQLRLCGYKEYIKTECTLEEKEGYSIVPRYSETDTTITQTWEYEYITEEIYDELPTT